MTSLGWDSLTLAPINVINLIPWPEEVTDGKSEYIQLDNTEF